MIFTNKPILERDGSVPAEYYDEDYWEKGAESGKGSYNTNVHPLSSCIIWAEDCYKRWGPFESFLELGCGRGWNIYGFLHLDFGIKRMMGIDFSHYAVTTAYEEVKPYLFEHDISDLTFIADKSFDFIFSNDVLEHLTPIRILSCLGHCKRVARKRVAHLISIGDGDDVPLGQAPSDQDQSHITLRSSFWWQTMVDGVFRHEDGWLVTMVLHGRTIEMDCRR